MTHYKAGKCKSGRWSYKKEDKQHLPPQQLITDTDNSHESPKIPEYSTTPLVTFFLCAVSVLEYRHLNVFALTDQRMVPKLCWDRFSERGQLQAVTSDTAISRFLPQIQQGSKNAHTHKLSSRSRTNGHTLHTPTTPLPSPKHTQKNLFPILTPRIKFILMRRNPLTSTIHSFLLPPHILILPDSFSSFSSDFCSLSSPFLLFSMSGPFHCTNPELQEATGEWGLLQRGDSYFIASLWSHKNFFGDLKFTPFFRRSYTWGSDIRKERWKCIFCPLVEEISVFTPQSTSFNNLGLHATPSGHHPCYQKVRHQGCTDALDVWQGLEICVRKQHFPGEHPREEFLGYERGRTGGIRIALVGWLKNSARLSNTCRNIPRIL